MHKIDRERLREDLKERRMDLDHEQYCRIKEAAENWLEAADHAAARNNGFDTAFLFEIFHAMIAKAGE